MTGQSKPTWLGKFNIYRQDPQKRPPPGWKVSNILYQRIVVQAQRTGCQALIDQVVALKDAPHSALVLIVEPVTQAAKGSVDAAMLNLQQIIDERKRHETTQTIESHLATPEEPTQIEFFPDLPTIGESSSGAADGTAFARQIAKAITIASAESNAAKTADIGKATADTPTL